MVTHLDILVSGDVITLHIPAEIEKITQYYLSYSNINSLMDDYNSIYATLSQSDCYSCNCTTLLNFMASNYFSAIQGPELCRHFKNAHIMYILPVNNPFHSTASPHCSLMLNHSMLPVMTSDYVQQ